MKNGKLWLALGALALVVGCYFLFFFDKGSSADPKDGVISADSSAALSAMEKRNNTLKKEADRPQDFVKIEIDPKKNLFGETVIEGSIRNAASITTYKDFELMIHWNDEAGMPLDSAVEVILETLDPGETVEFKTKRRGPRKSKSTEMTVRAAKASAH